MGTEKKKPKGNCQENAQRRKPVRRRARLVNPVKFPRYDDVYYEGLKWLEGEIDMKTKQMPGQKTAASNQYGYWPKSDNAGRFENVPECPGYLESDARGYYLMHSIQHHESGRLRPDTFELFVVLCAAWEGFVTAQGSGDSKETRDAGKHFEFLHRKFMEIRTNRISADDDFD